MSEVRKKIVESSSKLDDLLFCDSQANEYAHDSSIIGVGLVQDNGLHWCTVYDEDAFIDTLAESFIDDEGKPSEEDALDWYSYNTLGSYVGPHTPIFMRQNTEEDEPVALRFSTEYYNCLKLDGDMKLSFIEPIMDAQTFVFVGLDNLALLEKLYD